MPVVRRPSTHPIPGFVEGRYADEADVVVVEGFATATATISPTVTATPTIAARVTTLAPTVDPRLTGSIAINEEDV